MLESPIQEKIERWLHQTDPDTRQKLQELLEKQEENELREAFFQDRVQPEGWCASSLCRGSPHLQNIFFQLEANLCHIIYSKFYRLDLSSSISSIAYNNDSIFIGF